MICTVTFNPALDYVLRVGPIRVGGTNRALEEELQPGGKGVNVALVLRQLGVEAAATGFAAGYTGQLLCRWLADAGVTADFVALPAGMTRINVKLRGRTETELNGSGPAISPEALEQLMDKLSALRPGDTLVVAGAVPPSLPGDVYQRLLARLPAVRCVVDAEGPLLRGCLVYHPFLVKPNHHELGAMYGETLAAEDLPRVAACARRLQGEGARNVLVSLAGAGALLLTEEGQVLTQSAPRGEVRNSVGAGDSMVAGFLAGYDRGGYEEALLLGTAAGSATAFSPRLATRDEIQHIYTQLLERKTTQ